MKEEIELLGQGRSGKGQWKIRNIFFFSICNTRHWTFIFPRQFEIRIKKKSLDVSLAPWKKYVNVGGGVGKTWTWGGKKTSRKTDTKIKLRERETAWRKMKVLNYFHTRSRCQTHHKLSVSASPSNI